MRTFSEPEPGTPDPTDPPKPPTPVPPEPPPQPPPDPVPPDPPPAPPPKPGPPGTRLDEGSSARVCGERKMMAETEFRTTGEVFSSWARNL